MNRFRSPEMRRLYDAMLEAYRGRTSTLFTPEGKRRCGTGSMSGYFWRGFDGSLSWDASSRRMLGYACYRAGQDARLLEPPHDE